MSFKRPLLSLLIVFSLLLLASSPALSLGEDEIQKALDDKKFTDNLKIGAGTEGGSKGIHVPDIGTPDFLTTLQQTDNHTELKESADNSVEKKSIMLAITPGDGLLKASWLIAESQQRVEDGQIRFVLHYGTQSGKYTGSIEVGNATAHTVRDLKNFQIYYLQVRAYKTRDKGYHQESEEVSAVPLPAEQQKSQLEKSFSRKPNLLDKGETEPVERELQQFGYNFFRNSQANVNAMETLPAGDTYTLGSGDALNLTIWGGFNARHELVIDRNGEITIPKVGVVTLAGMTYDQARSAIRNAISRYYKNFELNLTLGKTRTITVYVVGEVTTPGSVLVSSFSTMLNAISAAGGPSRNGSLRNIRLMRDGKIASEFDLYDLLVAGDRSRDVRLQSGDTIFIPVIGPVVAVAGEVKRPGIYEMNGKTSLAEALRIAGGITAAGSTKRIQVERIANNASKVVLDFVPEGGSLEERSSSLEIMDRDMIKVFPVQAAVRDVVVIRGNVVRPGEYQFRKGMRIGDIITGYQDLLPETYLESAEITRLALPDYHREIITFNLRRALQGSQNDNIELQEQDSIRVFSRWEMQEKPVVSINGFVLNPGTYDYYPGMTVRDLIAAAGSTRRNAVLDAAELTRVSIDGDKARSTRIQISLEKILKGEDPKENISLQPDDVLIVRGIAEWIEATDKFVTLKGEVRFPGTYSITKGERLSSVIERAGGYSSKAYLPGAKYTRRSVREIQQKRMDEIIMRTEKDILQKQFSLSYVAASRDELEGTRAALEGLLKSLERLKALKAEGRIVIRLSDLKNLKASSYDLEMEGGDTLEIPARPNVVNVLGQVYNPTTFVHLSDSSNVATYLSKAGGPTRDAEPDDMYIIRSDGSVYSRQQSSFGLRWNEEARKWDFGSFMASTMEPGDTLVVPQKLERTAWLRDIKDITTILSQVALTAGSVFLWFK